MFVFVIIDTSILSRQSHIWMNFAIYTSRQDTMQFVLVYPIGLSWPHVMRVP